MLQRKMMIMCGVQTGAHQLQMKYTEKENFMHYLMKTIIISLLQALHTLKL